MNRTDKKSCPAGNHVLASSGRQSNKPAIGRKRGKEGEGARGWGVPDEVAVLHGVVKGSASPGPQPWTFVRENGQGGSCVDVSGAECTREGERPAQGREEKGIRDHQRPKAA